ncbi:protocatechuate 3,4-dioxygenase subunit beta [Chloroflexi bacterium TSY]|nr:protocatechuate 3,4-dioxygenase subunit beta [Chloroflexi bacterium TSY]
MTKQVTQIDQSSHPPYLWPDYKSTVKRSPTKPLIPMQQTLSELTGPAFGHDSVTELDGDLTMNGRINGEPLGERIIVTGKLLDERGRPIPNALVEVWQANAAGRYLHKREIHDAPLDPNFTGGGRVMTNDRGEYRFVTVKPGAYPWGNHDNAWRPAHIHFSVFGTNFISRLVTQMYFPGDPLLALDPIFNGLPNDAARETLIATYDHNITKPDWALGYNFDMILGGTPFED